jgi:hypothetical protein
MQFLPVRQCGAFCLFNRRKPGLKAHAQQRVKSLNSFSDCAINETTERKEPQKLPKKSS